MEGGGNYIIHRAVWVVCNWSGSSVLGRLGLMLCMTSPSKHFIMIGVSTMDGSRLDRTHVISLVPVWLLWIWDMWGWLPGSVRCWRYPLGHLSAVQHSFSVHGKVCCQDPQPCVDLPYVLLTIFIVTEAPQCNKMTVTGQDRTQIIK